MQGPVFPRVDHECLLDPASLQSNESWHKQCLQLHPGHNAVEFGLQCAWPLLHGVSVHLPSIDWWTCRSLQGCLCHDPLISTFAAQAISQRGNVSKKQGHAWHGKLDTWLQDPIAGQNPSLFGPVFWVCWKLGHSWALQNPLLYHHFPCQSRTSFEVPPIFIHLLQFHLAGDFDHFASSTSSSSAIFWAWDKGPLTCHVLFLWVGSCSFCNQSFECKACMGRLISFNKTCLNRSLNHWWLMVKKTRKYGFLHGLCNDWLAHPLGGNDWLATFKWLLLESHCRFGVRHLVSRKGLDVHAARLLEHARTFNVKFMSTMWILSGSIWIYVVSWFQYCMTALVYSVSQDVRFG